MKKNFIKAFAALCFIAFNCNCALAKDFTQYCSTKTAEKSFTGILTSVSGTNFLSRNIIEHEISKALKRETGSKFKVNVENFYGKNILSGEFNSLSAYSKNLKYDGFYMSDLNVETLCPYNYVNYDNKKLSFKENMVLKYSTKITQDDLDKTLNSTEYKKILDKMNSDKVISSLIKIQNSSVKIKDDKIVFNYEVNPLPKYDIISYLPISIKPFNISFGAGLKAQDGKLQLCNLELNSIRYNYSYLMPIVNLLNPLSYRVSIDKNNKGENEIQNVKITDSKIEIDGIILIKKNME